MILPIEGDEATGWKPGTLRPFLTTAFSEAEPKFSPDGLWLAYQSNETGEDEVYVRPFPGPGSKWQISSGGGTDPIWSPTRHELFYATPDEMMVVPYSVVAGAFAADGPRPWAKGFFARSAGPRLGRRWALHPDGQRFAVAKPPDASITSMPDRATFIFNFCDELRRIAPPAKR